MVSLFFSLTIFLGSFLLFLVQPLVGKMLMPSLGGSPMVWNTSLAFSKAFFYSGTFTPTVWQGKFRSNGMSDFICPGGFLSQENSPSESRCEPPHPVLSDHFLWRGFRRYFQLHYRTAFLQPSPGIPSYARFDRIVVGIGQDTLFRAIILNQGLCRF